MPINDYFKSKLSKSQCHEELKKKKIMLNQ